MVLRSSKVSRAIEMADGDVDDRAHAILRQALHDISRHARLHRRSDCCRIGLIDEQSDRPRLFRGRAAHVLDGVAARRVDADDHHIGIELPHARRQVLCRLQPGEQAIARLTQTGFDDFSARGIVVDQQDGQGLCH